MHKDLLAVARVIGDLKVSINGECKVSFVVENLWFNNSTQEIIGDQGCLFSISNGKFNSALGSLKEMLSRLDIKPYQNDEKYSEFVTDEASQWLKKNAWDTVSNTLLSNPNVFKVKTSFKDKKSLDEVITVVVEIQANDYVIELQKVIKDSVLVGKISAIKKTAEGVYDFELNSKENGIKTLSLSVYGDHVLLFGVTDPINATHLYIMTNGSYMLTSRLYDFNPEEGSVYLVV